MRPRRAPIPRNPEPFVRTAEQWGPVARKLCRDSREAGAEQLTARGQLTPTELAILERVAGGEEGLLGMYEERAAWLVRRAAER